MLLHTIRVVLVEFGIRDGVCRLHLSRLEVVDGDRSLNGIGSVSRIRQRELEELELVYEFLHHGVVPFLLVEDPTTLPVDRFEISLDARSLVCLFAVVALDVKLPSSVAALLPQQRSEDLVEKRVL